MSLTVISLEQIIDELGENDTKTLLKTFITLPNHQSGDKNDVEDFLHNKAIAFQRIGLATTHIVLSTYQSVNIIVGYFSIANKPIILTRKTLRLLTKTTQKKLKNIGYINPNGDDSGAEQLVIPAYLIGQLGKNYSLESLASKSITGVQLLGLAEKKLKEAIAVVNGKYCWLECIGEPKLIEFYESCGNSLVEGYESANKLVLFIKKIS